MRAPIASVTVLPEGMMMEHWTKADWAFVVSLCSAGISIAGFVWNVWSKFIFPKAKVRTTFAVMHLVGDGQLTHPHLTLTATNYGPGAVTLQNAVVRERGPWKTFWQMIQIEGVMNPLSNAPRDFVTTHGPFSGGAPEEVGCW